LALARGVRLGPYEIIGPLGAGGMGEVYRAIDPRLGRTVAITYCAVRGAGTYVVSAKAKASYETFLALWNTADPDVPILTQAKADDATLQ